MGPRQPTASEPVRGRHRGQAMVEFALVIPVFVLILAGIVDMGFMLFDRMTVINAAREGARVGVTQVGNPTGIPSLAQAAVGGAATGLDSGWLTTTSTTRRSG